MKCRYSQLVLDFRQPESESLCNQIDAVVLFERLAICKLLVEVWSYQRVAIKVMTAAMPADPLLANSGVCGKTGFSSTT